MDYYMEEDQWVRENFDLGQVIEFQHKHDIQIIRGEDLQYGCWIDGECWRHGLTFMGALVAGIIIYKEHNKGLPANN